MSNAKQKRDTSPPKARPAASAQGKQPTPSKTVRGDQPTKPEKRAIGKRKIPASTRIKVLKNANPFREGSKRRQVMDVLLTSATVGEAAEKCKGKGLKGHPNSRILGRAVERGLIEIDVTARS